MKRFVALMLALLFSVSGCTGVMESQLPAQEKEERPESEPPEPEPEEEPTEAAHLDEQVPANS